MAQRMTRPSILKHYVDDPGTEVESNHPVGQGGALPRDLAMHVSSGHREEKRIGVG